MCPSMYLLSRWVSVTLQSAALRTKSSSSSVVEQVTGRVEVGSSRADAFVCFPVFKKCINITDQRIWISRFILASVMGGSFVPFGGFRNHLSKPVFGTSPIIAQLPVFFAFGAGGDGPTDGGSAAIDEGEGPLRRSIEGGSTTLAREAATTVTTRATDTSARRAGDAPVLDFFFAGEIAASSAHYCAATMGTQPRMPEQNHHQ
mmetsp:Transcript_14434/g.31379  ORF Transcript_14434/g.31379 Transcript_14434/m.31379 type:complete len:203 (-) Transcript_14434:1423-2031(-)